MSNRIGFVSFGNVVFVNTPAGFSTEMFNSKSMSKNSYTSPASACTVLL